MSVIPGGQMIMIIGLITIVIVLWKELLNHQGASKSTDQQAHEVCLKLKHDCSDAENKSEDVARSSFKCEKKVCRRTVRMLA
jgi:hypothetical protein